MRILTIIVIGLVSFQNASAQSTAGITGKRDTSYATYSAWLNTKKTHPEAIIVQEKKTRSVKEKRDLVYCSIASRSLIIDAFYPSKKSKKPRTAVIMIHGGGWRTGWRSQHYPLAQALAAKGYVCFTPEYRLSTEALYPAAIYDLKAAVRWVHANAKTYGIDTSKIVIAGFSAGGELAAFIGNTIGETQLEGTGCNLPGSSNVNAIIDLDGTLSFDHPESKEGDDTRSTSAATYWFGYGKKDNLAVFQQASPLTHVSARTPPTLFINSAVPWMHAGREDYINVLNKHSIYTEVKNFEGAPHSFPLFEPWFTPMVQYMDDFMKKVLK